MKFLYYILNNWIAIVALLISIFTYWKSRKFIEVNFEDFMKIDFINIHKPEYKDNFYCNIIKIVNPSEHDIAYFDLEIYDPNNLGNYTGFPFYTEKNSQVQNYDMSLATYKISNREFESVLNLSYSNYGILKSNSYSIINLPVLLPAQLPDKICVQFKVSIKSLRTIKGSISRCRYKLFKKTYTLSPDTLSYYADNIKRPPVDSIS